MTRDRLRDRKVSRQAEGQTDIPQENISRHLKLYLKSRTDKFYLCTVTVKCKAIPAKLFADRINMQLLATTHYTTPRPPDTMAEFNSPRMTMTALVSEDDTEGPI